ncbi:hypothetical protein JXJ21_07745, partial [candidate division KSB1 bacterium]|nr:hypothetical protein [candidate division KSB1 bacterium]
MPKRKYQSGCPQFGITCGASVLSPDDLMITDLAQHPVFENISGIYFHQGGGLFVNSPAEAIAWHDDAPTVAVFEQGNGRVVVIGDMDTFTSSTEYNWHPAELAEEILEWMRPIDFKYIRHIVNFPAYPYNTDTYMLSGAFLGCGPTTGAMIFGYFDHEFGSECLKSPVSGVNEGLNTAWELHKSQYMNTGADGGSSKYKIKPGIETYAGDHWCRVRVTIHVSPTNPPSSTAFDAYGSFGNAWLNDGFFWRTDGTNWWIDPDDFCDFLSPKLDAGIPIFLTIDTDQNGGGDHWVPLIGYNRTDSRYMFYDTYDTFIHGGDIHYSHAPGPKKVNAIEVVRSVEFLGLTKLSAPDWLIRLDPT